MFQEMAEPNRGPEFFNNIGHKQTFRSWSLCVHCFSMTTILLVLSVVGSHRPQRKGLMAGRKMPHSAILFFRAERELVVLKRIVGVLAMIALASSAGAQDKAPKEDKAP